MATSWSPLSPLSSLSPFFLYALGMLLFTGAVKSQSDNYTDVLIRLTDETVTAVSNGTTFNLTLKDEVDSNVTLITEDNEAFQDWEDILPPGLCHRETLHHFSHDLCVQVFYVEMMNVSEDKWCSMQEIIRPYNEMTLCLERVSRILFCFYPNTIVEELFLQTHSHFFGACFRDEFTDPPPALLLTLTLLSVALIPVLVYVVICKNQNQECNKTL
ncbi:uncharacterized protein LOC117387698 [Periophthalmus magnuspinnatus]|uniref:uncharacterized protein LOC117387698 n=1 Tax=Periophthalmus magnuspinnatus TaxID=409849 RepID=UPI00243676C0|nr:uncharacterized protein LOC117387698 [Periophthalmus magnuspinnatus]